MFGMGMTELLVILAVALLVLGPKRLPELASGLGKAIREFRKATRDLSDQMEVDDTIRKPMLELKAALRDEPPPPDLKKQQLPMVPPGATIEIRPPGATVAAAGPLDPHAAPPAAPALVDGLPAIPPGTPAVVAEAAPRPAPVDAGWDTAAEAVEKSEPAAPAPPPAAKA